jgi:hypothetical protein
MSKAQLYKVTMSGFHRKVLLRWADEAARKNQLDAFYDEWKSICIQLQSNPVRWGDPQFDLKHSNMRVFRALTEHFIVNYAVDFDHREVIIKDLIPQEESGYS